MKPALPFDLSNLAHDLTGLIKSLKGLVNLSQGHDYSKVEAEEICVRMQKLTKIINNRLARELDSILK